MWQSLSIANKIYFCMGIIVAGYTVSMAFISNAGQRSQERLQHIAIVFPTVPQSQAIQTLFDEQTQAYQSAVVFGDKRSLGVAQMKGDAAIAALNIMLNIELPEAADKEKIQKLAQNLNEYSARALILYPGMVSDMGKASSKVGFLTEAASLTGLAATVKKDLEELTKHLSSDLHAEISTIQADTQRNQTINSLLFFLIVATALLIVIVVVRRSVINPIKQLSKSAIQIADGDFNTTLEVHSNDEVGDLGKSLSKMMSKIRSLLEESVEAKDKAEAGERAKSEFLATMSHEIRTPMNGVIGMVDVLHQTSLKGYQVEMVDLIRESAFSLLDIIDDILDISKIESGKLEIESAPMSVAGVVEKACGLLDQMAAKKGVELTPFVDPAIPEQVLGDALRLRQVLINLANNAIKFSSGQQRPGRVSVRAMLSKNGMAEGGPKQVVLIRIADNGIGMNEETLAGLFTPFSQADASTTRLFGGTGLGLAISRHLVELMGGEILVQSEPGKGSTFTVRLPFVPLRAEPDAAATKPLVAGLSCLVVGGTEGLAGDLSAYLTHDGATVERAADLAAARKLMPTLPSGQWIWIIDTAGAPPPLDELRAIARAHLPLSGSLSQAGERDAVSLREFHDNHELRFVVIGRGQRREPRVEDAAVVLVDGNVLTRGTLLKAVAIVAGRAQEERKAPQHGKSEMEFSPPSREEARQQGRLILVAEDNETNQKVVLQQLGLFGYAAEVAGDGREALERWQSGDYALLLSDLHMPKMDGYQLTAAIRAAETGKRRIPIIALSANALKGEAEHCRAAGMDDYLSKPAQLADLKAMLKKWLPVAGEAVGKINPKNSLDQSLPPASGKDRMGIEQWGSSVSTPSDGTTSHLTRLSNNDSQVIGYLTLPLQGGELARGQNVSVDVSVLKALVGDDEATIHDFLNDFRISADKIAAELRVVYAVDNTAAVVAAAHKLKSSARSVGALALGELCAEMEQAGKTGQTAELAALLLRFDAEMSAVNSYLDSYGSRPLKN